MKKIIFLCAMAAMLVSAITIDAQVFTPKTPPSSGSVGRGNYGTIQGFQYQTGTICAIVSNTVTPVAVDTLKNSDTSFVQFSFTNTYDYLFDFYYTILTGTAGGTAILQGSIDNVNWHTLTGNTTYCTGCVGASATITGTGTTHYQWSIPHDFTVYPYYQIRAIQTGTATATYGGTANYKY